MIPYIKFYLQLLCRILHCFSDTATERFSHSLMCFPKDTAIISYRRLLSWFQFSFVLFERYLLYFYTSKNLMNFWIHWSTSISWILCLSFNITKWFNWLILRQRIDPKFPNDVIDFFFNWFFSSSLVIPQNYISEYFWFTTLIFNFVSTIFSTSICLLQFWFSKEQLARFWSSTLVVPNYAEMLLAITQKMLLCLFLD